MFPSTRRIFLSFGLSYGGGDDVEKRGSISVAGVRWAEYERTKQWDAASPYLDSKYGETVWASLKRIPVRDRRGVR